VNSTSAPPRHAIPPNKPETKNSSPPKESTSSLSWPQWGGPTRDGHVSRLPDRLPDKPAIVWRQPLRKGGLGGIAATDKYVVLGDRDVTNKFDEFRCYRATDGEVQWTVQYPAVGELDYDNMPRATPLVYGKSAFLLGAFGDLSCVELESGAVVWRTNIITLFDGDKKLVWGTCSSPLIVDDKLIVNPGGPDSSVVALDPNTGDVIWQSPGDHHAYASFIVATLGGVRQLVGYDQKSLGGWDIATGNRLWTLKPKHDSDFNVSTPVPTDGKLVVTTENNATRLYSFDNKGHINTEPDATNKDLAPDISTPIVVGRRLLCINAHLYCLDLDNQLKPLWIADDEAFGDSAPLIASDNRLLVLGLGGEILLIDPAQSSLRIVSRLSLFEDSRSKRTQLLSYPALIGARLYVRGENELVCVDIDPKG
jgi:outer membrane protein assembly factor BamB